MAKTGSNERILIAEDDDFTRLLLARTLRDAGFRVLEAANGRQALDAVLAEKPALLMIDVEMPEMSGLDVVERIRARGAEVPVLVLSGRATVRDRVTGLKTGADDYLVKPYEPEELLARVEALLRRHERGTEKLQRVEIGRATVDLVGKTAVVDEQNVRLTRIECAVVELLARNRGKPVSREQMLDQVWDYTYLPATRTLDTHIWRLRKKLGDVDETRRWITNLPGVGYRLELVAREN